MLPVLFLPASEGLSHTVRTPGCAVLLRLVDTTRCEYDTYSLSPFLETGFRLAGLAHKSQVTEHRFLVTTAQPPAAPTAGLSQTCL